MQRSPYMQMMRRIQAEMGCRIFFGLLALEARLALRGHFGRRQLSERREFRDFTLVLMKVCYSYVERWRVPERRRMEPTLFSINVRDQDEGDALAELLYDIATEPRLPNDLDPALVRSLADTAVREVDWRYRNDASPYAPVAIARCGQRERLEAAEQPTAWFLLEWRVTL